VKDLENRSIFGELTTNSVVYFFDSQCRLTICTSSSSGETVAPENGGSEAQLFIQVSTFLLTLEFGESSSKPDLIGQLLASACSVAGCCLLSQSKVNDRCSPRHLDWNTLSRPPVSALTERRPLVASSVYDRHNAGCFRRRLLSTKAQPISAKLHYTDTGYGRRTTPINQSIKSYL